MRNFFYFNKRRGKIGTCFVTPDIFIQTTLLTINRTEFTVTLLLIVEYHPKISWSFVNSSLITYYILLLWSKNRLSSPLFWNSLNSLHALLQKSCRVARQFIACALWNLKTQEISEDLTQCLSLLCVVNQKTIVGISFKWKIMPGTSLLGTKLCLELTKIRLEHVKQSYFSEKCKTMSLNWIEFN